MIFDSREKDKALSIINSLRIRLNTALLPDDEGRLRRILFTAIREGQIDRDTFGLNPILMSMQTAYIAVNEIGLRRDSVIATLPHRWCLMTVIRLMRRNVISVQDRRISCKVYCTYRSFIRRLRS